MCKHIYKFRKTDSFAYVIRHLYGDKSPNFCSSQKLIAVLNIDKYVFWQAYNILFKRFINFPFH